MKFFLHRVFIWVNIQKKFQVPRSYSIGEKCDANFKISSHFSRKLCDQEAWNFFCIEYSYGLIYIKNFKFIGCTVSEKNAILISSYHRIFLENCATDEHEIFLHRVLGLIYKKNFTFLGRTVWEKNAMLTCKIFKFLLGQLCNFEFLQDIIAFFSETVQPRNMKFFLHRVSIWVNNYTKNISCSSVAQYRRKMRR